MKLHKTVVLSSLICLLPALSRAATPATDNAGFYEYIVTAVRIKGPLRVSNMVEASHSVNLGRTRMAHIPLNEEQKKAAGQGAEGLPSCVVHLSARVPNLAPSQQVFRFQVVNGEGNSSWNLAHETTNKNQSVQGIECDFWPGTGGHPTFTLAMLKKALGSSVEIVEAVRATGRLADEGLVPAK